MIHLEKEEKEFNENLRKQVDDYNANIRLMIMSEKSYALTQSRYELQSISYCMGEISLFEFTTTQKEMMEALYVYHEKIREVWTAYYSLCSIALYDFISQRNLEEIITSRYDRERKGKILFK